MRNTATDMDGENIKNLFITMASVLLAYFAPVQNMIFVIFFVFLLNCLCGLIAGILCQNERFSLKKFLFCLCETALFYVIVLSIFFIGEKMQKTDAAIQCITGVVYAIVYFYSTNILRNCKTIVPDSKVIAFLYYVVSFEFVKYVPFLKRYLESQKNQKKNDTE